MECKIISGDHLKNAIKN